MANSVANEVLGSFLAEARSNLPAMRKCLQALAANCSDREALEELHRLAHNVRGASNIIGMPEIGQLAEGLEDLLRQISEGLIPLDAELVELMGQGLDHIESMLDSTAAPAPLVSEAKSAGSPADDLAGELVDGFLVEADEHLHLISPWLRELEQNPGKKPLVQDIRRSVHTIKGAAAMVGLPAISKLAHRMEDLLDHLYEDTIAYNADCQRLLYGASDLLAELVSARGQSERHQPALDTIYTEYQAVLSAASGEAHETGDAIAETVPVEAAATQELAPDAARTVRVPIEQLDQLMRLVGELFVQHSFFERQLSFCNREVDELGLSQERLKRISSTMEVEQVNWLPGTMQSTGAAASGGREEFDALEFDRYTQLHLVTRDLSETGSDLNSAGAQLRDLLRGFNGYVTQQERLTSEIQDKLMRLRMVPLSSLANRLERTVRVTASRTGKMAEIFLHGLSTELDKKVIEELAGPLEHLLRNAVDHGIEDPAARVQAGKSASGRITLRASQEGTDVVIRLSDDGAGLNEEKLRREAVGQGYATDPADLSWDQLMNFVFEPGFSTAGQISEISGRGVGLDVVKTKVESLKGSVSMESVAGEGVTFTLRLPMTLAITKVLLVEAYQQTVALPVQSVLQAARLLPAELQPDGDHYSAIIGSRSIQVMDLARVFGLRHEAVTYTERVPVVVVRAGERDFGLIVDGILEAREVAVQPLTSVLRRLQAVAGTTILGDGSVVLILNPAQLHGEHQVATPIRRQAATFRKALNVLIVDDSLSVRRVVANLIRNTGWHPFQAKDGVEALEILGQGDFRPDAILLDVEMPRMDGFELTERLRERAEFEHTPIIMLTSRAGEKHRNRGFQSGVNEYLVKPYQDEVLLATIRRHVAQSRDASQVA
ncbi:MAG: response regulator [Acidimicrobiia bacterium]|nr:response regulator [Acidimicrobiia bacterium]